MFKLIFFWGVLSTNVVVGQPSEKRLVNFILSKTLKTDRASYCRFYYIIPSTIDYFDTSPTFYKSNVIDTSFQYILKDTFLYNSYENEIEKGGSSILKDDNKRSLIKFSPFYKRDHLYSIQMYVRECSIISSHSIIYDFKVKKDSKKGWQILKVTKSIMDKKKIF